MIEFNSTFLFTIANILILYFLLRKFLFKPVTEFMEKRTNSIKEQLAEAENKLKEADTVKAQYEETLKSAHIKADEIIKAAKDRANKEYEKVISNAHHDAKSVIERANQSIELEREKVMKEMRNEITSLAFSAASKLIQKNMNTDENRKIVENFLNEKGVA